MYRNNLATKKLEEVLGEHFGLEILNSIGIAMVVLEPNFHIVWANKEYRKVQEKPQDKIVGKKCYEVSFGSDKPCPETVCAVRKTLKSKENARGLKTIKREGEEKFLDVYSFPLMTPDGQIRYVVEVIQDNTQLYKLVELSDRLTAFASHELKSPLATIHQIATVLTQIEIPLSKQRQLFGRILSRSQHGLKTVENFLIYSKIKGGELEISPKKVIFSEVVNKVLDFQKEYILKPGVSFRCEIPGDLEVVGDPDYIEIIYNNLITNAIKYGEENTEIYFGYCDKKDNYHYLNVANMGDPIPEEARETIFKRYVTTHKEGSGIGLDVTTELVKKHGGEIWVEPCCFVSGRFIPCAAITQENEDKIVKGNNFVFTIRKSLRPF